MTDLEPTPRFQTRAGGSAGVYKWLCGLLLGALIGTLTGEFMPNRNVVTHDQMVYEVHQEFQPLSSAVQALTGEVSALKDVVNSQNERLTYMQGQLQGKKIIGP